MRDIVSDFRSAVHSLRRDPGFVLMAVLALAVGIGCTATVFGMVNQLLLRPVPGVADPDQAAYLELPISEIPGRQDFAGLNTHDLDDLRRNADLLTGIGSWSFAGTRHVSGSDGRMVEVVSSAIYGDFFEVLSVRPAQGRLLRADETGPDADPRMAVIGESLARRLFGDAGNVAGQTIQVEGESITVLGVAGHGFQGPERRLGTQLWLPISSLMVFNGFDRETLTDTESTLHVYLVTRLRPGVDAGSAETQVARLLHERAGGQPSDHRLKRMTPRLLLGLRLPREARRRTEASLALFAGVVSLVLLIACANVATLLFVRNVIRRPTIATRRALGASSGRIARYHLVESAVVAGVGTVVGLGAAWFIALIFQGQRLTAALPALGPFTVDGRMLMFAVAAGAATLLLSGAAPAALAGRFDLADALRGAGGPDSRRMASVRRFLSAGQVAVCVSLLVATGLLTRTVHNLYTADTGLSMEGVWALDLGNLTDSGVSMDLAAASEAMVNNARRVPGVEDVAVARNALRFQTTRGRVRRPDDPDRTSQTSIASVSPGWFQVFGVGMATGRTLGEGEWQGEAPVPVVLTPRLAQRLFGSVDVVGRAIGVAVGDWREGRVVGVTTELQAPEALGRPLEVAFVPIGSTPIPGLTLLVRTGRMGPAVMDGLRAAVQTAMPDRFVSEPVSLKTLYGAGFSEQRLFGRLLGLLSGLAMVLASVGLYSVIAFTVAQRTREFSVRLALGAEQSRIASLVLGEAASIAGLGIAVGLVGAYMLSILLETRLYGVAPLDPLSYGAAAGLFAVVAILASWVPASRAMRSDPMEALREG